MTAANTIRRRTDPPAPISGTRVAARAPPNWTDTIPPSTSSGAGTTSDPRDTTATLGGSAGTAYAALVPHGAVGLVDRPVGAVDQEAVEAAREPAVVGDREHGALEPREALFQRLRRLHVQVVGRLVEQQQGGAGQLQQQDLEPCLLATGERLEALVGCVRELVAIERP